MLRDYRGIALLSVVGKVYTLVLLRRVRRALQGKISDSQAGFTEGRGTIDHIFSLRQLIERRREFDRPFFAAFVDFKQAFDSIHQAGLWELLLEYGVPAKLVRLIKELYAGTACSVRVNG